MALATVADALETCLTGVGDLCALCTRALALAELIVRRPEKPCLLLLISMHIPDDKGAGLRNVAANVVVIPRCLASRILSALNCAYASVALDPLRGL